MSNREVMQQALEALKSAAIFVDSFRGQKATQEAIADLKAALEQPEQEPVAKLFGTLPVYDTPPAAQRQWVGLTDEDVNRESAMIASKMKLAFHAGMYVAQQILKERNT